MIPTNNHPERYGPHRPPTTVTVAQERLTELSAILIRIQADLKTKTLSNFDHDNLYWDWHRKASLVQRLSEAERIYLEDWVRREHNTQNMKSNFRTLRQLVNDTLADVSYSPLYSDENKPGSSLDAESRRIVLAGGIKKILQARDLFDAKATEFGLGERPTTKEIRARLSSGINSMEPELHLLKLVNRIRSADSSPAIKALDPQPSGVSTKSLHESLYDLKQRLEMDASQMLVWIFTRVKDKSQFLALAQGEEVTFDSICEYVKVTEKRLSIEFPHRKF